jgi:hypothetical protein
MQPVEEVCGRMWELGDLGVEVARLATSLMKVPQSSACCKRLSNIATYSPKSRECVIATRLGADGCAPVLLVGLGGSRVGSKVGGSGGGQVRPDRRLACQLYAAVHQLKSALSSASV